METVLNLSRRNDAQFFEITLGDGIICWIGSSETDTGHHNSSDKIK